YDPADRDDLCLDPRRIAQMADAFSRALDVDPRRLLDQAYAYGGSVAKIVKLEHAWRRLDGRNDDGFQVAPFPG
ncbi:aminoglycoside phosphotransferase family protein, partial [Citrobacter freundii]